MRRENPLVEKVEREVFTDREDILARLQEWLRQVENHVGRSRGLIGHRRVGKTALLVRLYNDLFWQQGMLIPFYFAMEKKRIWLKQLAADYFSAFARQYVAFRLQEPMIVRKELPLEKLDPYLPRLGEDFMVEEIRYSPRACEQQSDHTLFHHAIHLPTAVAATLHQRVIVRALFRTSATPSTRRCWWLVRRWP